jgi:PhnB protein
MKDVNLYLIFNGNCRQAMEFYQKCLGGKLDIMKFSDAPGDHPPQAKDMVMHARLAVGSVSLMASDGMPGTPVERGNNFSITLQCESAEEVDKLFAALSDKGKVTMPPGATFWAARFAMATDQFGINWMFNYEVPKKA